MVVLWRIYVGRFFIFSESKEFKKCKNKDCAVKIGKNRTNQRNLGLRLTNLVSFLEHNLEFRSSNLNANTILFTWEITFFIERDLFLFFAHRRTHRIYNTSRFHSKKLFSVRFWEIVIHPWVIMERVQRKTKCIQDVVVRFWMCASFDTQAFIQASSPNSSSCQWS